MIDWTKPVRFINSFRDAKVTSVTKLDNSPTMYLINYVEKGKGCAIVVNSEGLLAETNYASRIENIPEEQWRITIDGLYCRNDAEKIMKKIKSSLMYDVVLEKVKND